jgi:hypothetical protein
VIDFNDAKTRQESKCKRITYRHYCDLCESDLGYRRNKKTWTGMCRVCFNKSTHSNKIVSKDTKEKMCKNHHLNNGGIHPLLGKQHSLETKLKISQKQSEYCKLNGNQFIGHNHSKKTVDQLSKANSGKEPKWKGRTFQYNGPKGFFKMRSSYELFYANWMDSNKIEWQYEPQYKLSNGKTFSPDFQLSSGDIIEVKGYWAKAGLDKWTMFCLDYPNMVKKVLMRDDLVSLGMEI